MKLAGRGGAAKYLQGTFSFLIQHDMDMRVCVWDIWTQSEVIWGHAGFTYKQSFISVIKTPELLPLFLSEVTH